MQKRRYELEALYAGRRWEQCQEKRQALEKGIADYNGAVKQRQTVKKGIDDYNGSTSRCTARQRKQRSECTSFLGRSLEEGLWILEFRVSGLV